MEVIKEALTFDDVLLVPRYSSVLPSETYLHTDLGHNIKLKIPFLSSAMDTVTESSMAVAIAQKGGLGIIHRNFSITDQISEIKKRSQGSSFIFYLSELILISKSNSIDWTMILRQEKHF